MAGAQVSGKIKWKWIRIPEEVWRGIKEASVREKMAEWKVINRAVTFYVSCAKAKFKDVSDLSKVSWYVYKFSASVGEFRGSPTPENYEKLLTTCRQISERLGIDTSKVALAAEQLMKKNDPKNRMVLNDASKEVVAQIILKFAGAQPEQ